MNYTKTIVIESLNTLNYVVNDLNVIVKYCIVTVLIFIYVIVHNAHFLLPAVVLYRVLLCVQFKIYQREIQNCRWSRKFIVIN